MGEDLPAIASVQMRSSVCCILTLAAFIRHQLSLGFKSSSEASCFLHRVMLSSVFLGQPLLAACFVHAYMHHEIFKYYPSTSKAHADVLQNLMVT